MKTEVICAIISAVISAIVSSCFALLLEKRKERREDKKEILKKQEQTHRTKPELKIIGHETFEIYSKEKTCDMEIFLAPIKSVNSTDEHISAEYDSTIGNADEWCGAIYTFQNVGKTDIKHIDFISSYKRSTSLFACTALDACMRHHLLGYSACLDTKIRVGESFTLKICYHKDHIVINTVAATITIGIRDINGRFWQQPLFAPYEKIYDSQAISAKGYQNDIDDGYAIKKTFHS